jgi:hypothetical protein
MITYRATAALFGGAVAQLNAIGNASVGVEHHRPSQLSDLAGAQAGVTDSRITTRSRRG